MDIMDPSASIESVIDALQYNVGMGYNDVIRALLMTHFRETKLSDMAAQCHDILHRVVKSGSSDTLRQLMPFIDNTFLRKRMHEKDKNYITKLLCLAIENGQLNVVKVLCENGADVNVNLHGNPLLHFAITQGHDRIAEMLVEFGADVKAVDKRGETVLIPTIISKLGEKGKLIELFVNRGVDPQQSAISGKGPIHVAAAHSAEAVRRLVDLGCDVNARDTVHSDTPLHVACWRCCKETTETLIKLGAHFNAVNNEGETPLEKLLKFATDYHNFHSQSRIKLAQILVKIGFKLNFSEKRSTHRKGRVKVNDLYNNLFSSKLQNVSSLQHMCRLAIRNSIHCKDVNNAIRTLQIPVSLCGFVAFSDFLLEEY